MINVGVCKVISPAGHRSDKYSDIMCCWKRWKVFRETDRLSVTGQSWTRRLDDVSKLKKRRRTKFNGIGGKVIHHRVLEGEVQPMLDCLIIMHTLMTLRSFSGPLTPRIESLCSNCTDDNKRIGQSAGIR